MDLERRFIITMKSIKYFVIIGIITLLIGCNFADSNNQIDFNRVIDEPKKESLIGLWEVDSFSYNFISNHYKLDSKKVELKLVEDGTFIIKNYPDFEIGGFGKPINNELNTVSGKWNLKKIKDNWNLEMIFDKSQIYRNGISTLFELYLKSNKLIIWNSIGDPDQGNRLMFVKKE
tara:strand:- start:219 stop:743 length:525 start_codon:yes stop_codon:yes gene_type:complete